MEARLECLRMCCCDFHLSTTMSLEDPTLHDHDQTSKTSRMDSTAPGMPALLPGPRSEVSFLGRESESLKVGLASSEEEWRTLCRRDPHYLLGRTNP